MSAPATARAAAAQDAEFYRPSAPGYPGNGGGGSGGGTVVRLDVKMLAALLLNAAMLIYGYGVLNSKVDGLHERLQRVEDDVRALRTVK